MSLELVRRVNVLRTARLHLSAQVAAGRDTPAATVDEAQAALARVEDELAQAEAEARTLPECGHLFGKSKVSRPRTGRTPVPPPRFEDEPPTTKEETMARKSNAAALEEVLVALRRAEKSAGTTKWALEGAGAKKNPPSPERAEALRAKLEREQALVAELRAKRDDLKAKVKS